ncbi:unnamed protein product [Parnassius apollo]|uniref:(apollo) hypothetical protein n=1 Tax=Parnassius apollo TaxID=110799 RepID=A0A8S3Y8C8_PARAO|nr:unnamed protein product [Parnassius apollo]
MNVELVKGLLETIQNVMVSNMRHDDSAVSIFDLDKNNDGAAAWCESFDKLGDELKWSSFEKVAKAGKALRGSALSWFDTWEPETDILSVTNNTLSRGINVNMKFYKFPENRFGVAWKIAKQKIQNTGHQIKYKNL